MKGGGGGLDVWGGDESGSDVAVGFAEALLWSFSNCCFVMMVPCD